MSNPCLQATGLRRIYAIGHRTLEVLRGVDLTVEHGEFVALCGASGAGKSTLLHLLGGLDRPDAGEVRFQGTSLGRMSSSALPAFRNRHVGYVFQSYHLLPELDALENVALPARMARHPFGEAIGRARELLRRVGLGDRLDHLPQELSGGEQQRVCLARSLVNGPQLILADEPTGNLDSRTGEEILQLLLELRQELGTTLVIATHDTRVAAHAGRVVAMADGRIMDSATEEPLANDAWDRLT
ncbi:MAG: ABC transporter ATP-binding protein [Verrucomicrobiae bacterium]|nr:ABC transporter ATP-binding protein [Verrucomicrobiae bacterium]